MLTVRNGTWIEFIYGVQKIGLSLVTITGKDYIHENRMDWNGNNGGGHGGSPAGRRT